MATDNTVINLANVSGGDVIRNLARGSGNTKTQVVQLDIGGSSANSEVLITAGQQLMGASIPVVIASNQPALPVIGTMTVSNLPSTSGIWSYDAGIVGTLIVGAGKRVLQITAVASTLAAGSMTINGGNMIIIPIGGSITISPNGTLVAPTIVFTTTIAYFVEEVL